MTNLPEEERTAWVVSAASQLRVPAVPPVDLWPAILARISGNNVRRGRPVPWFIVSIILALILISGSVIYSKVVAYRASRPPAVTGPTTVLHERLDRAARIGSDHDRSVALIALVDAAKGNPDVVNRIIRTARPIGSSLNKANVLVVLATSGAITTPLLREAYISAASTISSKHERERALDALHR